MSIYRIKEIFWSVQGEGSMTGTPTVFIRFSGCNMWNGKAESKKTSVCPKCDTDFVGGKKYSLENIINAVKELPLCSWVTLTGGEPALQVDADLVKALQVEGYKVAMETNGSMPIRAKIDWLVVSPKLPFDTLKIVASDDLKLLFPHPFLEPEMFRDFNAKNKYLQPLDGVKDSLSRCMKKLEHLKDWKLSLQTHKLIGVR